ncbi:outer membrane beta-barrel protein [Thaumasiovibrio subtropicus]|uniref:outer membrane beta-barrel protein n=1 Tax=Thaumasiovibrio subtropicus TaxID=1891207 RepID=UPI000B350E47|nr:outer membrane beta-barrel protein [Thaumasiovibrio subtropicus]
MRKLITLLSLLAASATHANGLYGTGDSGLYVGYAYGNYKQELAADTNYGLARFKADEWSNKFYGGFQLNENLAVEAFYTDFGRLNFNDTTATDTTATGGALVASFPLGLDFNAYGKVGMHKWRQTLDVNTNHHRRSGNDIVYGAGVSMDVANFNLRFEYERYDMDSDHAGVTSVGIAYRF